MQAKCGTCKGTHDTIAEYKDCAGVPRVEEVNAATVMDNLSGLKSIINKPSDRQVTYAMDLLRTRAWPDELTEEDLRGMERRQVSELIDALFKAPRKSQDRRVGANGAKQEFKDIPKGRYALEFADGWKFFQIGQGHTRTFVDMLIGSPGAYRKQKIFGANGDEILKMIRKVTPRQASIDFGLQSGTCGVCSSPLTNKESLELGIGPICRGKMGW